MIHFLKTAHASSFRQERCPADLHVIRYTLLFIIIGIDHWPPATDE
jgi:hypothetical protein